jgi:hypothetical protein
VSRRDSQSGLGEAVSDIRKKTKIIKKANPVNVNKIAYVTYVKNSVKSASDFHLIAMQIILHSFNGDLATMKYTGGQG